MNYGLDECEAFESEVAGLVDAITDYSFPLDLELITIIDNDSQRAFRLQEFLKTLLPMGYVESARSIRSSEHSESATERLRSAGYSTETKPHIFVAMPITEEMKDVYDYGIMGAAKAAGFVCERADISTFTGDVLEWVKRRIKSAKLVVADLSYSNANVYLEVGYAWGCGVRTVLIAKDAKELKFDIRGQRCLVYNRIKELEDTLKKELLEIRRVSGI